MMTIPNKTKSFHRALLFAIAGFSLAILIASIGVLTFLFIDEQKSQLDRDINQWGKVIAQLSIEDLHADDFHHLQTTLSTISLSPRINYIHVYKQDRISNRITFFTSFNRSTKHPAIPDKISKISALSSPKTTDNYLELIVPVKDGLKTIGYVYIQASIERVHRLYEKTLIAILLIISAVFFIAVLISTRLTKTLVNVLTQVTTTIRDISDKKDFSLRIKKAPIYELDSFVHNLNNMFNRAEKHINVLSEKNDLIIAKNTTLEQKVSTRTDALKESNQELLSTLEKLHQFQNQIVESEKMASLGDMVAGVAHEVNTPIGLGVTASTLLEDRINDIKNAFDNKTLKSSQLDKFLNEGQENIAIIYRNLQRAAGLISSFKKVAVDQSNNEDVSVDINNLFNEVLLTLAPRLRSSSCEVLIDCPKDLIVFTKSGAISQILINLIMNSIIHGFEDKKGGKINLKVNELSNQLNLTYSDNGKGIDPSVKHKVFDPFTTTKRGEGGSGLGLHLVYNLVTQALGGNIQLTSEPEQGVLIEIYFPIKHV